MRILVVNDDGITSEGIKRLAQLAARFGEVWVVAPDDQCSAMSQKITVRGDMKVKRIDFPVPAVQAYSGGSYKHLKPAAERGGGGWGGGGAV